MYVLLVCRSWCCWILDVERWDQFINAERSASHFMKHVPSHAQHFVGSHDKISVNCRCRIQMLWFTVIGWRADSCQPIIFLHRRDHFKWGEICAGTLCQSCFFIVILMLEVNNLYCSKYSYIVCVNLLPVCRVIYLTWDKVNAERVGGALWRHRPTSSRDFVDKHSRWHHVRMALSVNYRHGITYCSPEGVLRHVICVTSPLPWQRETVVTMAADFDAARH